MRRVLFFAVAAAALAAAAPAPAQEPAPAADAAPPRAVGTGRHAALSNALALYSPFESPWADLRVNHAFESHLFSLMRAEVRLWDLQDALAAQDGPAREEATEIGRIVHEQILVQAAEALPLLQKTPNKPFALLLVRQLEAYPYEWKEEGAETLLPGLHKLTDPPSGNPPAENGRRRRRPRAANPPPGETPAATPAARP